MACHVNKIYYDQGPKRNMTMGAKCGTSMCLRWVFHVWFIIVVDLMLLDDLKSLVMLSAKHC